jgi:hypothetical protein
MSKKSPAAYTPDHLKSEVANEAKLDALRSLRARIVASAQVDSAEPDLGHIADLIGTHPLLHVTLQAHLLDDSIERGACIILWGQVEGLGGCLSIPYLGVKGFTTAGSVTEALGSFEMMLADPDFKWKRETAQKKRLKPGVNTRKH